MPSQLRGAGSQRAERASIDSGTGDKRVGSSGRADHISRGTFINKQKDLGINTTEAHAQQLRGDQAAFNEAMAKDQSLLATNRAQQNQNQGSLKAAQDQMSGIKIPGVMSAVDKAWAENQKSLVTFRTVDAKNNIVGSYKLPASLAEQYQNKKGIFINEVEKGIWNLSMKERHHVDQLNESFKNTALVYESSYKKQVAEKAAPQIKSALKGLGTAKDQLAAAGGRVAQNEQELLAAEARLSGAMGQREQMWTDVRTSQKKRSENMAAVFNSLNLGRKK